MKPKKLLALTFVPLFAACMGSAEPHELNPLHFSEALRSDPDAVLLDVRRPDEYAAGHIPNAINVPNESIGTDEIPELPDKDQLIMVYCRSGRRSKEASEKLVKLGYTNIVEFGGILDWKGETVTGQK